MDHEDEDCCHMPFLMGIKSGQTVKCPYCGEEMTIMASVYDTDPGAPSNGGN